MLAYSDFIGPILQPKKGCLPIEKKGIFPISDIFSQSEDFIKIYSQI